MLISIEHRFVFVANVKCGSTAIARALRPYSDIVITETEYGKHESLADIQKRYSFIFSRTPIEKFVVFGVIRPPVDFVLSVYNSHKKKKFAGQPQSTAGVSFDEFWTVWRRDHGWMLLPQRQRFLDASGKLGVKFIVHYDCLERHLSQMFREAYDVALPLETPRANVSPRVLTADRLTADQVQRIRKIYAEDETMLRERTGVWLGGQPDVDRAAKVALRRTIARQRRGAFGADLAGSVMRRLRHTVMALEGGRALWWRAAGFRNEPATPLPAEAPVSGPRE
jgi:hypothetical protein